MRKITPEDFRKVEEIRKLYGVTEAEQHLLVGFIAMIQSFGWSRQLTVKLLQTAAALIEMITDEDK